MNLFRPTANRRFNELVGLLLLVIAALLCLSLLSYHPSDPSIDTATVAVRPANWVGPVGANVADLLFQSFGVAAFFLVVALTGLSLRWLRPRPTRDAARLSHVVGVLLCMLSTAALLGEFPHHLLWRSSVPWQGVAGTIGARWLIGAFNPTGGYIVTGTFLLVGVFLATTFSFAAAAEWWSESIRPHLGWLDRLAQTFGAPFRAFAEWQAARREARLKRRGQAGQDDEENDFGRRRGSLQHPEVADFGEAVVPLQSTFIPARTRPAIFEDAATRARRDLVDPAPGTASEQLAPQPVAMHSPEPIAVAPLVTPPAAPRVQRLTVGQYKIPPLSLLQEPGEGNRVDENELRAMAARLRTKCEEFDVHGQVNRINPGPVVTTYEFKPEPGVKYNRITALTDDLCLALEAESIYIERLPGKSTVGIEVPNRRRETILLREIIGSDEFHRSQSPLTMALGKDINGEIAVSDLAAMPHLLIAGSTGAGKSVALNSMIVSLLYKATPDQVRLILVDPKRLELGLYDGVPHLYTPIITEPKLAANALRNATREMERRLKLLASRGVRNIAQYNRLFEELAPSLFENLEADPDNRPLPYIVIVIDELADLMIVDAANVEESITRLAQMARAVGIHLILATQRPSVDVITGLIKANFPARMSFRVATKVDSRTILDAHGAELLLGKGDMLFLPPGTSRFHRVHGAFVTEKEIVAVVGAWRKQATPEFDESFLRPPAEETADAAVIAEAGANVGSSTRVEAGDDNDDPLFEDAVRVVVEYGKASTSLLQRRLRIGYGRAAHLIDLMYADGIVGPADGPKPRELMKRPDWIAEVDAVLR